jgi:predicted GNAT family acetyltransferase
MNLNDLDNPGWNALNSHHLHLSTRGEMAARYQPDTFQVAAMPENTVSGFNELRQLVDADEPLYVVGTLPKNLHGWQVLQSANAPQMICQELKPAARIETIQLNQRDVPEMLDLVALAQPGPFLPRTIEMGHYYGIRQEGKLVAMAGERLHLSGFCEISAVCTHPDQRGRGYAAALTTRVAQGIFERGEQPFLHLAPNNHAAMRLYQKLGFRLRTEIELFGIQMLDA